MSCQEEDGWFAMVQEEEKNRYVRTCCNEARQICLARPAARFFIKIYIYSCMNSIKRLRLSTMDCLWRRQPLRVILIVFICVRYNVTVTCQAKKQRQQGVCNY